MKQSATKRNSYHANYLQNQAIMSSESEAKRSKQVMDPLAMESMAENILSFLDVESLKAARQVNKLWSIEGAKILLKKCYAVVPLDVYNAESSTKKETLEKFKSFLSFKSNDVSMIPKITIDAVEDFESWKSLGVLGPQVHSVKLSIIDDKGELLHNFLNLLPNLKYLRIGQSCNEQSSILIKILTSLMSSKEKGQNPLIISFLFVSPNNLEEFADLEKFADCNNIMIEKLKFNHVLNKLQNLADIPNFEARTAGILTKLLFSSQNTLKKMTLFLCEIYLSLVKFPKMIALKKMDLLFFPEVPNLLCEYKFSPCFRFSEKVPNLDYIYMSCCVIGPREDQFFETLFEKTGPAPSVKSLVYYDTMVGFPVKPLFRTFPNTQRFNMIPADHTRTLYYSLCKHGGNIKTLVLDFDVNPFLEDLPDLDSILTGFAPETVERIKKFPKVCPYTLEELQELRVNPSILDLKGLKVLELRFLQYFESGLNLIPERVLAIAGEFTFKLMPKDLEIIIRVEDSAAGLECARKSLEEVSKLPNVTVDLKLSPALVMTEGVLF